MKGDFTTEVLCEEGLSLYANCSMWLKDETTKQGLSEGGVLELRRGSFL